MSRVKRAILILTLILLITLCLVGCNGGAKFLTEEEMLDESTITGTLTICGEKINGGKPLDFKIELYYDKAPMAVSSFISLSKSGFYDGTIIHRIKNKYDVGIIELGGYEKEEGSLVRKKLDYTFAGEFKDNGWNKNDIKHETGVLTMLSSYYENNNAGSIFGIVVGKNKTLDGKQAAFGRIVSNVNLLDSQSEIYNVPTENIDSFAYVPKTDIKIVSIEIDTNGKEFDTIIKNTK